jgi:molybdopterin-guanine dinucleotide biosynthesis protein MobB
MGMMGLSNARVPVFGFVAPSGTGKTTLLRWVIALLKQRGLRIGVVKQSRRLLDIDQPCKDSDRLRRAGIERLLLASSQKLALIVEQPGSDEPSLNQLLTLFDQGTLDVILVEGFRHEAYPKLELLRDGQDPLLYPRDLEVIALVAEQWRTLQATVPVLNLNDPAAIAEFVLARLQDGGWQDGTPGRRGLSRPDGPVPDPAALTP